jgi:hypothetical protein
MRVDSINCLGAVIHRLELLHLTGGFNLSDLNIKL